jgi:HK97 family phage major capsid protein
MTIFEKRALMGRKFETLKAMKEEIELSGRSANAEEKQTAERLLSEIDSLDLEIRIEEKGEQLSQSQRPPTRPDIGPSVSTPGKHFRSFGEQLQAIRTAGTTGGQIDTRLYQVRAATGLSESIGGKGGYLIEPTFSREIITSAFNNGQIAKLCREIPIGANSNSVKINGISETSRVGSRWGGIVGYFIGEAGSPTPSAPKFRQMELTLKKFVCLCYGQNMAHMAAMPC